MFIKKKKKAMPARFKRFGGGKEFGLGKGPSWVWRDESMIDDDEWMDGWMDRQIDDR